MWLVCTSPLGHHQPIATQGRNDLGGLEQVQKPIIRVARPSQLPDTELPGKTAGVGLAAGSGRSQATQFAGHARFP